MRKIRVKTDFATIQDAINAACAGDIILVESGVYTESLLINKDDIAIKGDSSCGSTILDSSFVLDNAISLTNSKNICISGFSVRNYRQCGFLCHSISNLTLQNCTVHNCGSDGVYLSECDRINFDRCEFSANGICGIEAHESAMTSIRQCKIRYNGGCGVYLSSSFASKEENSIYDCKILQNNSGGIICKNINIKIFKSNISSGGTFGILLEECNAAEISKSNICSNFEDGISIISDECTLTCCRINSNDGTGLLIKGNLNDIYDNEICKNGRNGLFIRGIKNTVKSNLITQNSPFDIVRATPQNKFKNNISHKNNPSLSAEGDKKDFPPFFTG